MTKLKTINGVDVSDAIGFVYDGCHKIYLVYSDADVSKAREWGYDEVYPMDEIYETYRYSCGLRFIEAFGDFRRIVPQFPEMTVEFRWDNGVTKYFKDQS